MAMRMLYFFIGARLECLIHRLHDRSLSCKLLSFAFAFGQDGRWCGEGYGAVT